jgi:dTDP-4-dehydrorhamnose reductase
MWSYLRWLGVEEAMLAWFLEHPCPPDLLGVNYYLTSERVLDESHEHYPEDRRGGNGRDGYADMEAVRVRAEGMGGWAVVLREAWERYHLPLALTEVHLGSTRDEQVRWLLDAWQACADLRSAGVDVRALTVWSLFGAFDWNHLVTCGHDFYEPGAFDVRGPRPRPTAVARHSRGPRARYTRLLAARRPLLDATALDRSGCRTRGAGAADALPSRSAAAAADQWGDRHARSGVCACV